MERNQGPIRMLVRQGTGAALIVALVAGGISLASFAQGSRRVESRFGVSVSNIRLADISTASNAMAASAAVTSQTATSSNLEELLEQSPDWHGKIVPLSFEVSLDGEVVLDSGNWDITLEPGRTLPWNTQVKHQIKAQFYPQNNGIEPGDSVTWNMGRIEGLTLDEEFWEPLEISGNDVADIWLYYTSDGSIYLHTEFREGIYQMYSFTVTYWYESGFMPVSEPELLEFDLPGYEEPVYVTLLPEDDNWQSTGDTTAPEESSTDPETTAPEESTTEPEESTTEPEETTAPEESTTAPEETTKPEETTAVPPKRTGGGGGTSVYINPTETSATLPEIEEENSLDPLAEETVPDLTQSQESRGGERSSEQREKITEKEVDSGEAESELVSELILGTEAVSGNGARGQALPGETIIYRLKLRNESGEAVSQIRIRDFLPEHTSFLSAGKGGVYGVVNGQQYITWTLEHLAPGEETELHVEVRVFPCTASGYALENRVYWQADDEESVYSLERPLNEMAFPGITIG